MTYQEKNKKFQRLSNQCFSRNSSKKNLKKTKITTVKKISSSFFKPPQNSYKSKQLLSQEYVCSQNLNKKIIELKNQLTCLSIDNEQLSKILKKQVDLIDILTFVCKINSKKQIRDNLSRIMFYSNNPKIYKKQIKQLYEELQMMFEKEVPQRFNLNRKLMQLSNLNKILYQNIESLQEIIKVQQSQINQYKKKIEEIQKEASQPSNFVNKIKKVIGKNKDFHQEKIQIIRSRIKISTCNAFKQFNDFDSDQEKKIQSNIKYTSIKQLDSLEHNQEIEKLKYMVNILQSELKAKDIELKLLENKKIQYQKMLYKEDKQIYKYTINDQKQQRKIRQLEFELDKILQQIFFQLKEQIRQNNFEQYKKAQKQKMNFLVHLLKKYNSFFNEKCKEIKDTSYIVACQMKKIAEENFKFKTNLNNCQDSLEKIKFILINSCNKVDEQNKYIKKIYNLRIGKKCYKCDQLNNLVSNLICYINEVCCNPLSKINECLRNIRLQI